MTADPVPANSRWRAVRSLLCGVLSSSLLIVFLVSHIWRADQWMMATIFPVALWLSAGLFLVAFVSRYPRARIALCIAWLAAVIWLGDAPQCLIRAGLPPSMTGENAAEPGIPIRIVSLNCLSMISAIKEIRALEPDVVLTQESPSREAMETLVSTEYDGYQLVWSGDASMLVRGSVAPIEVPRRLTTQYVLAEVSLDSGAEFNIASTRLIPSPLRFDIWNPAAWRQFANNRRIRHQQLTAIFQQVSAATKNSPMILGGDFNAPARDAIFEILKPELHDGWPLAGRGWGKTIVNNAPVHRIDQIWISPQFSARSVTAKKTICSDHRMVIGDYWLKQ